MNKNKKIILGGAATVLAGVSIYKYISMQKNGNETIRIWLAGCSTGEEVYSLAMLFDDYIKKNKLGNDFKIFATDVDSKALHIGGLGQYNINIGNEIDKYYLISSNVNANKYMFDLYKHPKLQWLMITAISPGIGKQRHQWIKRKKKGGSSNNDILKELKALYPNHKIEDLELMSQLVTKKEIKQYVKDLGEEKAKFIK